MQSARIAVWVCSGLCVSWEGVRSHQHATFEMLAELYLTPCLEKKKGTIVFTAITRVQSITRHAAASDYLLFSEPTAAKVLLTDADILMEKRMLH